jgi:hypothetical protein
MVFKKKPKNSKDGKQHSERKSVKKNEKKDIGNHKL